MPPESSVHPRFRRLSNIRQTAAAARRNAASAAKRRYRNRDDAPQYSRERPIGLAVVQVSSALRGSSTKSRMERKENMKSNAVFSLVMG